MKELSIEEKAKAYDEAIERAKEKYAMFKGMRQGDVLEEIFPELKESENEKIRKALINHFRCVAKNGDTVWTNLDYDKVIAWLEKQGEQKPAWSEEDEAIYYGVIETEQYMLDVVNGIKKFAVGNISIKEECTIELNWLKSLKEKVQPKKKWSEEDERMLKAISIALTLKSAEGYLKSWRITPEEADSWLKSLRPLKHWKPSDEQMDALNDVISSRDIKYDVLSELWKDLEKLKGLSYESKRTREDLYA